MTSEQINEVIATKIMGWHKGGGGCWWLDNKNNYIINTYMKDGYIPATNWVQAEEALEKFCIDNDYKIRIEIQPHCCIVEIGGRGFPWHRGQVVYMSASNKVDAICNALIEALEKK